MYKIKFQFRTEREVEINGDLPDKDTVNFFEQCYQSYKLLTEEERSTCNVIGYHDCNDEQIGYRYCFDGFKVKPTQMIVNFTTGEQFTFEPVSCNVPDITLQVGDMLSELGRKNVKSMACNEEDNVTEWKFIE